MDNAAEDQDRPVGHYYIQEQDLNDNGIPDRLERDDFARDYDAGTHRNGPLGADDRTSADRVASSIDAERLHTMNMDDDLAKAAAEAARLHEEDDRNPRSAVFESGDLKEQIDQIRKKRIPKSSIAKDLARLPPNKSNPDTGLEVGKQVWRGMIHGFMSEKQDMDNKRDAALAQQLEEARDAQKELDRKEAEAARADEAARKIAGDKQQSAGSTNSGDGGSGPATPDASGASGAPGSGEQAVDAGASGAAPTAAANDGPAKDAPKASPPSSDVDPAKATGTAGLGMAVTAVNPAAGVIGTAIQTHKTQKDAGQQFETSTGKSNRGRSAQTAADVAEKMEARRNQKLSVAPAIPTSARPDRMAAPAPANDMRQSRKGSIFNMARKLPQPSVPTLAKGPPAPAPRVRAIGLGTGLTGFMTAVRKLAPKTPELSAAAWQQKQRDSGGLSR